MILERSFLRVIKKKKKKSVLERPRAV